MNNTHDTNGVDQVAVTATDMNTAIADGTAEHLSAVMTGFARYRGQWWIEEIDRWLLVDDPDLATFLDAHRKAVIDRIELIRKT